MDGIEQYTPWGFGEGSVVKVTNGAGYSRLVTVIGWCSLGVTVSEDGYEIEFLPLHTIAHIRALHPYHRSEESPFATSIDELDAFR